MHYIVIPGLKFRPTSAEMKTDKFFLKGEVILKVVAEHFGFTPEALIKLNRKKEIVHARRFAIYFLKHYTNLSLLNIGKLLGNRDHTTVYHNLQTLKDLLDVYPALNRELLIIDGKL